MTDHQALFEQVALYLGAPWKYDRLSDAGYNRYQIIDGSGRVLTFIKEWNSERFKLNGKFPHGFWQPCKSIGFSATRPATDIAADIRRRFLTQYIEAYDQAKKDIAERQEQEQHLQDIAQCLAKVTHGTVDLYGSTYPRNVYFENGKAEIYKGGDDITLTVSQLSPEIAIKLAAYYTELSKSE